MLGKGKLEMENCVVGMASVKKIQNTECVFVMFMFGSCIIGITQKQLEDANFSVLLYIICLYIIQCVSGI
jgi:hypothetical protein